MMLLLLLLLLLSEEEEKGVVEEQLCDVQGLLIGEQERHRQLQESRARELEQWGEEKAASLGMVQEMSREVEELRKHKAEISLQESGERLQDGEEVFGDLPARIAEMETEIRAL